MLRGRLIVFNVFRAHRRAHEDEIVLKIRAVQNFGRHRIKKRLSQFRLMQINQQANVVQLHLLPNLHRLLPSFEFFFKPQRAFFDPQIVELNPLTLRALLTMPILRFKAMLGALALGAKQLIVAIESIEHRTRDVKSNRGVEFLGKHSAINS